LSKVFLITFVCYILWVIAEPVRFHYREKYAGRWHVFSWKAVKIAVATIALISIAAAAPAYFWWLLLAGSIFIAATRRTNP